MFVVIYLFVWKEPVKTSWPLDREIYNRLQIPIHNEHWKHQENKCSRDQIGARFMVSSLDPSMQVVCIFLLNFSIISSVYLLINMYFILFCDSTAKLVQGVDKGSHNLLVFTHLSIFNCVLQHKFLLVIKFWQVIEIGICLLCVIIYNYEFSHFRLQCYDFVQQISGLLLQSAVKYS